MANLIQFMHGTFLCFGGIFTPKQAVRGFLIGSRFSQFSHPDPIPASILSCRKEMKPLRLNSECHAIYASNTVRKAYQITVSITKCLKDFTDLSKNWLPLDEYRNVILLRIKNSGI